MTSGVALTLLGFGLGTLLATSARRDPRASSGTLRDRAIVAQQAADRAARRARDLVAQWSAEERT